MCTRTQRLPKRLSQTWLWMLVNANLTHAKCFQSRSTLCDPMDCSLPDTSVYGISQARILEWVSMPSSRESSRPRDQTHISMSPALAGRFFTTSATRVPHPIPRHARLHFGGWVQSLNEGSFSEWWLSSFSVYYQSLACFLFWNGLKVLLIVLLFLSCWYCFEKKNKIL